MEVCASSGEPSVTDAWVGRGGVPAASQVHFEGSGAGPDPQFVGVDEVPAGLLVAVEEEDDRGGAVAAPARRVHLSGRGPGAAVVAALGVGREAHGVNQRGYVGHAKLQTKGKGG